MDPVSSSETIALAFLERYLDDRNSGRSLPLAHYLDLFPDHERVVAEEYLSAGAEPVPGLPSESSSSDRHHTGGEGEAMMGPYALRSVIGAGGQGTIWLADDTRLLRTVAVKVLRDVGPGAAERVRRFRRESQTTSRLYHPCICVVHDAGITNGTPWIAMQYVDGETLAARIRALREPGEASDGPSALSPVAVDEMLAVFEKLAQALHLAHEQGVVHRDLKPGNVMITRAGEPVILDFGLAHDDTSRQDVTGSGDLFGTPAYMAPEQLSRSSVTVDRRLDVWALGVTLYECLTLRHPFERPTREGLYQAILAQAPPDPCAVNRALSKDLRVVLETAIEKDIRRRYQTALAFAEDLSAVRARLPVSARRVGPLGRGARWARREPAQAALAGLTFTAVTLLAALSGYLLANFTDLEAGKTARLEQRSDTLVSEGYAELGEGDAAHAIQHFTDALVLAPASAEASAGLVMAHLQRGDGSRALAALDSRPPDFAARSAAAMMRVQALDLLGRSADAAASLDAALPPPDDAADFFLEGQYQLQQGHAGKTAAFARAARAFTNAIVLSRSPKAIYYEARLHAAGHTRDEAVIDETIRALLIFWPEAVGTHRQAGMAYFSMGRYDDAVRELREALRRRGDDPHVQVWLAKSLSRQGAADAGISMLRATIASHPERTYTHQALGETLLAAGRFEDAIVAFDAELVLRPRAISAHLERSRALWSRGEAKQAIAGLEAALAIQPDHFLALVNLGTALKRSGDRDGSVAAYRRAIAQRSQLDDPMSLGLVASALWDCGDRDAAFAAARETLARWPDDADAHHRMALLQARAGQLDDAAASLRRALAIDPGRTDMRRELGFALASAGRKRAAVPELEAYLASRAEHHEVRAVLGSCLVEIGERELGLASSRHAAEAAPTSAEILTGYGEALLRAGEFATAREFLERTEVAGAGSRLLEKYRAAADREPAAAAVRAGGPLPREAREVALLCEVASRKGWHAESASWYRQAAAVEPDLAVLFSDEQLVLVATSCLSNAGAPGADVRPALQLLGVVLDRWQGALAEGRLEAGDARALARGLVDQRALHVLAGAEAAADWPADERARWKELLLALAKLSAPPS